MRGRRAARGLSEALAVAVSAVVGVVVAVGSVWFVTAAYDTSFETLYRIDPEAGGDIGGVGADWTAGNTDPLLDFLIALTHAADVIMGAFILVMLFVHWGAFRRLAARMQEPGERASGETVAADGGEPTHSASADAPGGDGE
ncbi:hypothetical protein [Halobacterium yunchengense]|uniref:hypothetical protein n=1 Tax=Halobacterium yunchengense TaxID=3108497 RepID=UPI0030081F28